jgi:hypothetical protein
MARSIQGRGDVGTASSWASSQPLGGWEGPCPNLRSSNHPTARSALKTTTKQMDSMSQMTINMRGPLNPVPLLSANIAAAALALAMRSRCQRWTFM